MTRTFEVGENTSDVISKINKFINDDDNVDNIMGHIGNIMSSVDKLEMTVGIIEDDRYKNEMLGYIAKMRQYVASTLDAFDSMMDI